MNIKYLFICLFLFSVFISSCSQILLKKGANKTYKNIIEEYLNPLVITAYSIFLLSSFLTMYSYKYVPLSIGPMIEAVGYVFIAVLGRIFLKEKINKKTAIGMGLILIGIVICSI
ncbi:MAG: EamA family transporter [Lachnospiraceae bacterium]